MDWDALESDSGPMFFGQSAGNAASASGNPITYTALVVNPELPSFYYMALSSVTVDGSEVNIPAGTFDINSTGR